MPRQTVAPNRGADILHFEQDMVRLLTVRKERILVLVFDELPALGSRGKELEILMKMIAAAEVALKLIADQ